MDAYKILGLPYNAEFSEIRKSYLQLAEQWNPRTNSDTDAPKIFQDISDAYAEITTIKNFNDIYSEYSNDILIGLCEIFKETVTFKYTRVVIDTLSPNERCERCTGKGNIVVIEKISDWNMIKKTETCEECKGRGYSGKLIESECTSQILTSKLILDDDNVTEKITIQGAGDYFLDGTCRDLKIRFKLKSHPKFKFKNGVLSSDVTVSFKESLLGFEREIDIIDNVSFNLKMNGPVKNLQSKRIKLKDYNLVTIFEINIIVTYPKKLTSEQRTLIEEKF
jgi:DnaJ-class molecular chaperone